MRVAAPIRDLDDFRARLPRKELHASDEAITVETQFFLVQGIAKVGRAEVRMQTLLLRSGLALPEIVWQRRS